MAALTTPMEAGHRGPRSADCLRTTRGSLETTSRSTQVKCLPWPIPQSSFRFNPQAEDRHALVETHLQLDRQPLATRRTDQRDGAAPCSESDCQLVVRVWQ